MASPERGNVLAAGYLWLALTNPRTPVGCPGGHGFHLGCTLDWLERGHDFCPLCDGTIGGVAASLLEM